MAVVETLSVVLSIIGVLIFTSTSTFYIFFTRNSAYAIGRISLYRHIIPLFSFFLSLNFIFIIGLVLSFAYNNADLFAILVYAIGVSMFFTVLTRVITRKRIVH